MLFCWLVWLIYWWISIWYYYFCCGWYNSNNNTGCHTGFFKDKIAIQLVGQPFMYSSLIPCAHSLVGTVKAQQLKWNWKRESWGLWLGAAGYWTLCKSFPVVRAWRGLGSDTRMGRLLLLALADRYYKIDRKFKCPTHHWTQYLIQPAVILNLPARYKTCLVHIL